MNNAQRKSANRLVVYIRRTLLREQLIERTPGQVMHAARQRAETNQPDDVLAALSSMQRQVKGGKCPIEIADQLEISGWYFSDGPQDYAMSGE